jgi:hypothetical protein
MSRVGFESINPVLEQGKTFRTSDRKPAAMVLEVQSVIVQAYQTSQYVVPRGGIFLGN